MAILARVAQPHGVGDRLAGGPGRDTLDGGADTDDCNGGGNTNDTATATCETLTLVP